MADSIHIKLPDGNDKEFRRARSALDVAKSISRDWRRTLWPRPMATDRPDRPLEKDTDSASLTEKDAEALEVYRHSSAHCCGRGA